MKWLITILLVIAMSSIAQAQGFGHCTFGDYTFGSCVITPLGREEGVSLGGSGSITIPPNLIIPFGTESINETCPETKQILDGRCYDCNPERGYLIFNPNDRSVECALCSDDYTLINQTCVLTSTLITNQTAYSKLFTNLKANYGSKINPLNPAMGVLLLAFIAVGGFMMLKEKKEDKPSNEGETDEDED